MFHTMRPRLSYANVMSTLAVFVALGGSSVAAVQLSRNSVRSEQIANGQVKGPDLAKSAVTSVKVADRSLLAGDFKAGQLKAGPAGPQGPAGPKGDPGATSLKVRAATASGTVTANCEPGERATGGGAHSGPQRHPRQHRHHLPGLRADLVDRGGQGCRRPPKGRHGLGGVRYPVIAIARVSPRARLLWRFARQPTQTAR
jgi:hypothetical protein